MQIMDALWGALAGLIALGTAIGWYLLTRLKRLESSSEKAQTAATKNWEEKTQAQNAEIQKLRFSLAQAEAVAALVPDLQKQIGTVLAELADVRTRLDKSEAATASKQDENEKLTAEKQRVEKECVLLRTEVMTLKIERGAYQHALALVHGELLAKDVAAESAPQTPETPTDASAASAKEETI